MIGTAEPGSQRRGGAYPCVSVIIPVHNGERFIGEAIGSVLTQSLAEFELIVVDDASTDRTAEIVSSIEDPRLRFVVGPKRGISGTLNAALELSRAELIARLDADDVMDPERLERQVAYLSARPNLGGAASYYWLIDEQGRACGAEEPPLLELEDLEHQLRHGGKLIYPHPTVMLRKAVLDKVGYYDSRFDGCEDVELFMRMYEAGRPLLVQPERLTSFRVHPHSVTATRGAWQYFLNEAIFGNLDRRRRSEPELAIEAYVAAAHSTMIRRLVTGARIRARRLRRAHTIERMRSRPVRSTAALIGAALLDVGTTIGALRRKLRRLGGRRAARSPARGTAAAPTATPISAEERVERV